MSRYATALDVAENPHFANMGDEWHDKAEEYVDNVFVKAAGYSPDAVITTGSPPWLLKQIAIYRAMELYSQASTNDEDDFWANQARMAMQERRRFEKRFDRRVLVMGDTEYSDGEAGGASAERMRV